MSKVYVVSGLCGYGEDRVEWNVKGFLNKEKAEKFQSELEKLEEVRVKNGFDWINPLDSSANKNDYDKTGIEYYITELDIDLENELP